MPDCLESERWKLKIYHNFEYCGKIFLDVANVTNREY